MLRKPKGAIFRPCAKRPAAQIKAFREEGSLHKVRNFLERFYASATP
jgi:hypothetical protein